MAGVATGIYSGSRLPTFIGAEPDRHPNRLFLAVWLGVMGAVVLLLALAMIDWVSTRRYARRQRLAMDRERAEILRRTFRDHPSDADGQADGRSTGSA